MASFMAAQLPSEDEEDLDFNPANELQDSDEEAEKKAAKKKADARKRRRGGGGGVGFEGDEVDSESEEGGEVALKKTAEDKAKAADVWALMNAGVGNKGKALKKRSNGGAIDVSKSVPSIEALCQGIASKKKGKKHGEVEWMRHLGVKKTKKSTENGDSKKNLSDIAAKALSDVKNGANNVVTNASGMITIEETRRFAGKNITVQRDVGKDSKEARRQQTSSSMSVKKEGLDAVLEQIAPAKKVTVMDKSKSDWKDFKTKDDLVLEELEAHKKSGGTYLEKKDFLAAADLKAYEKERDARLGADVRNRGRL